MLFDLCVLYLVRISRVVGVIDMQFCEHSLNPLLAHYSCFYLKKKTPFNEYLLKAITLKNNHLYFCVSHFRVFVFRNLERVRLVQSLKMIGIGIYFIWILNVFFSSN